MPRTKIQIKNLQRAITPKIVGIELWFLYTAFLHNVTYLSMKFEVTSFNTFEIIPQTTFPDVRTDAHPLNFVCGVIIRCVCEIPCPCKKTIFG